MHTTNEGRKLCRRGNQQEVKVVSQRLRGNPSTWLQLSESWWLLGPGTNVPIGPSAAGLVTSVPPHRDGSQTKQDSPWGRRATTDHSPRLTCNMCRFLCGDPALSPTFLRKHSWGEQCRNIWRVFLQQHVSPGNDDINVKARERSAWSRRCVLGEIGERVPLCSLASEGQVIIIKRFTGSSFCAFRHRRRSVFSSKISCLELREQRDMTCGSAWSPSSPIECLPHPVAIGLRAKSGPLKSRSARIMINWPQGHLWWGPVLLLF